MRKYTRHSIFPNITEINNPFWHLESDGFWHLNYQGERLSKGKTPSKAWLKDNVFHASFDDDLWVLLQNRTTRQQLRDYIVAYKLQEENKKTSTEEELCSDMRPNTICVNVGGGRYMLSADMSQEDLKTFTEKVLSGCKDTE